MKFSEFNVDLINGISATVPPASDASGAPAGRECAKVEVRGVNCKISNLLWSWGKAYSSNIQSQGASSVEIEGCDLSLMCVRALASTSRARAGHPTARSLWW